MCYNLKRCGYTSDSIFVLYPLFCKTRITGGIYFGNNCFFLDAGFLIAGIFPLVPGAGIYWTAYYVVTDQLAKASARGFLTLKIAVAIVLGILFVFEFPQKWFRRIASHETI